MKKVKLFSFALAALMLGACSSEDGIDNGGQGTVLPGEKGYISLAINLPTTPSTRANDDFDDGLEYGAQNEAYMSRSAEKWVRCLCFNELGVSG